ncbi:Delphilin [Mactra antiquata]
MPLRTTLKWPKHFGFDIIGQGPCFVINVEKGGIAYHSGLQPGDQILELDGQDVINMSAEALKTLAKHSRSQPPTLGVVSRLMSVDIVGTKTMGLGFVITDHMPVTVWNVEEGGPAHSSGVRPGDVIVEVNGKTVKTSEDVRPFLGTSLGRVTMTLIPLGKYNSSHPVTRQQSVGTSVKTVTEGSRVKRAKDLHEKVGDINFRITLKNETDFFWQTVCGEESSICLH